MARMTDGERAAAQYDAMATEYSADNDDGVFNALYERPAMLRMLGDVAGRRVLDLGCGAGQLSSALVDAGATVVGIDVSPAMIDIARSRLDGSATFSVGDISHPLPFDTNSFDLVVASLVMHYLKDWTPVLREVARVLKPDGVAAFSTHHPTMDWQLASSDDYFAKKQFTETWTKGGKPFEVTAWRRPLAEMSREIRDAGFVIEALHEPMPATRLANVHPTADERLRTRPHFLFVRAVPDPRASQTPTT